MKYYAPARIAEGYYDQLDSRLAYGYIPIIGLSEVPSDLSRELANKGIDQAHIDLGTHSRRTLEQEKQLLNELVMHQRQLHPIVDIKVGSLYENNPDGMNTPDIAEEIVRQWEEQRASFHELESHAYELGFSLRIENRPRPNYQIKRDDFPIQDKRFPGFKTNTELTFSPTATSNDIYRFLWGTHAELELDLEHLTQTAEYAHLFNFHRTYDYKLRKEMYSEEEQQIIKNFLGEVPEVFADYTELTTFEQDMLTKHGWTARKGQPLVYSEPTTVVDELESPFLIEVPTSLFTPGFQVYHVLDDIRGGKKQRIIGSHLPGIKKKYIEDDVLREKLFYGVFGLHTILYSLFDVQDVKIEPQIGRARPVYLGTEWEEDMRFTILLLSDMREQISKFTQQELIHFAKLAPPHIIRSDY